MNTFLFNLTHCHLMSNTKYGYSNVLIEMRYKIHNDCDFIYKTMERIRLAK